MPNLAVAPVLESMHLAPVLVAQGANTQFATNIQHALADERVSAEINRPTDTTSMAANDNDFWGNGSPDDWRTYYRPYNVVNGVLQIPVMGSLLAKFSLSYGRWATGYKYIEMALKRGLDDNNVSAIALVIDSPGGMVTDCFELCTKIREARATKPIRAFAADHAYSAAYAIASSADSITVTSSGGVGSIGVVTMHVSYKDMLAKAGIEITFIFAGEGKVDGNAYEDLPKGVKDRIQVRINKIYGVFVSTVNKGRGMDEDTVRGLKAYTYDAEEGVEKGLADKIGALDEELANYAAEVADNGDDYMADAAAPQVTGKKTGAESASTGVDLETYRADVNTAEQRGLTTGRVEGATAERGRISAILALDEGKEKPKAAMNVAMKTSMTVEEAKAFLGDMPKETAEAPKVEPKADTTGKNQGRNHFAEAMNASDNPEVGSGDGDEAAGQQDTPEARANTILADFGGYTGAGKKKSA